MKLNIVSVLNSIANEEATVMMLIDPYASWNINSEIELRNAYDYYKTGIEMENEISLDLIEHCIKYGWEVPNISYKKLMTYDEWLKKEMEMRSKYLIAA